MDYSSINSSILFHPGLSNVSISINITDDTLVELSEVFQVILTVSDQDADRIMLINDISTVTINDNDRESCDQLFRLQTLGLKSHCEIYCFLFSRAEDWFC